MQTHWNKRGVTLFEVLVVIFTLLIITIVGHCANEGSLSNDAVDSMVCTGRGTCAPIKAIALDSELVMVAGCPDLQLLSIQLEVNGFYDTSVVLEGCTEIEDPSKVLLLRDDGLFSQVKYKGRKLYMPSVHLPTDYQGTP
ncbi:MAG: hypothetical protein COB09_18745 [Thalassobium sp.]|nr:MAG: hypothetical protein COB09_18745 [Thalassobium sp.]